MEKNLLAIHTPLKSAFFFLAAADKSTSRVRDTPQTSGGQKKKEEEIKKRPSLVGETNTSSTGKSRETTWNMKKKPYAATQSNCVVSPSTCFLEDRKIIIKKR